MELQLKIEQYEGPLDLLLALITKHKLDIFDIPIAQIAEQYTAYLDAMQKLDMEIAGEFLVMAAELMLIKSRMLLPQKEGEEDPRKPLEHQRARRLAEFLQVRSEQFYDRFPKPADELTDPTYHRAHAVSLLTEAFERIAARVQAEPLRQDDVPLFRELREERYYTVEEKLAARHACPVPPRQLRQPVFGRAFARGNRRDFPVRAGGGPVRAGGFDPRRGRSALALPDTRNRRKRGVIPENQPERRRKTHGERHTNPHGNHSVP